MQEQPFLDKNERRCAKRRVAASCGGVGVELTMRTKAHDEKTLGTGARAMRLVCSVISYFDNWIEGQASVKSGSP